MKKLALLSVLLLSLYSYSQEVYFQEGFETSTNRAQWTQELVGNSSAYWDFVNGGVYPQGAEEAIPASAINGIYNARFYKQSQITHETFLISPSFSLELSQKPLLSFYYSQYANQLYGGDKGNTKFSLYYRTPDYDNEWRLIRNYFVAVDEWIKDSIPVPDSVKFSEVQLGFKGISSQVGYSTTIDSILIVETDTLQKYVDQVYCEHPNQDIVPTDSRDNPILRLRFPVKGNEGELILNELKLDALLESEQMVPEKGLKLFFTTTEYLTLDNPIGDTVSFIDGQASFSDINYSLPNGNSYVWITYDVSEDNSHSFKGKRLDGSIPVDGILLNSDRFPENNALDPNGYREVNESVFYDDFDDETTTWTLSGEFEIGEPLGLGGTWSGNPDPTYTTSGKQVLGTDLSGLGSTITQGDYEYYIDSLTPYTAETQTFNCKYFKDLNLQYYRWLNASGSNINITLDYSVDEGSSWTTIWKGSTFYNESNWSFIQHSLSNTLDRAPSIRFRYTLGNTEATPPHSGWNIDNFALTGNYVNNDVGVSAFFSPATGCGLSNSETVSVRIKNFGFDPSKDEIPLGYSTNNGYTWTRDTLRQSLESEEYTTFDFATPIDLSSPGKHRIIVSTLLSSDEDARNDAIDTTLFSYPYYELPYSEDFESNDGYWFSQGDESWAHGTPAGTTISTAASGSKAWVTNLEGNYTNNNYSYLESPCFNFTGVSKAIFECKIFAAGESGKDGLALYYSLDEGSTWTLVPKDGTYDWNWYNNTGTISALGNAGWDVSGSDWFLAREFLPAALANQSSVKFRLVFASDASGVSEGFGVDDIRIYNAPLDLSLTAIVEPVDACLLSKEQPVSFTVTNADLRAATPNDTLLATLKINNEVVDIDTFNIDLATGASTDLTFNGRFNMWDKATYTLEASILAPGDTSYYGTNNNTLSATATVQGIPDYTLGPDRGTANPALETLDAGAGYSSYLWTRLFNNDQSQTTRYYSVDAFETGTYIESFAVVVTNSFACTATDTLTLINSVADVGIAASSSISSECFEGQSAQTLSIAIQNFSADTTYHIGDTLTAAYKLQDAPRVREVFTLTKDLAQDDTAWFAFNTPLSFVAEGEQEVLAYTSIYGELDFSNDTLSQTVELYSSANVEIGNDTIFTLRADTLLFDVGANLTNIKWQDGSSTQTYDVGSKKSASYFVEATDLHGCKTDSDTVFVVGDSWLISEVHPLDMCEPSASEQVEIVIKNGSNISYTAGETLDVKAIFEGETFDSTITLPAMAPNATYTHTFTDVTFDLSETGSYPIYAAIMPKYDIKRSDNIVDKDVNVFGIRTVELAYEDIVTKRADTIVLDAGANFASYLWQDGSTAQTFSINSRESATYTVEVTDYNDCPSSTDTVNIFASDLNLVEIVSPSKSCDVSSERIIRFTLENTGNDEITSGDGVDIILQVDDNTPELVTYYFAKPLETSEKRTLSIVKNMNFDPEAVQNLTVTLAWEDDYFNDNDEAVSTVYQLEVPTVDLGDDLINSSEDEVELCAPEGYESYKWQDGATSTCYTVSTDYSAEYWVRVRNSAGCSASDTVYVIAGDLELVTVNGPENTCDESLQADVEFEIAVNGADTLMPGDIIKAYYTINDGFINYEKITLADSIYQGKNYYHTFTDGIDRTTGTYEFWAEITYDLDFVADNNEYTSTFRVGSYPIDLGNGEDTIKTDGSSVILDAGDSFTSYTWSTGETTQSIEVYFDGTFWVEAYPGFDCPTSDTVVVDFTGGRVLTEMITPDGPICGSNSVTPLFYCTNIGDSVYTAGTSVTYTYRLNDENTVIESASLGSDWTFNKTLPLEFATPLAASDPGYNDLLVRIIIEGDTVSEDVFTIISSAPDFSFESDFIEVSAYPITLDPGIDDVSYAWSTGETTKTIEVDADGTYTLTVTDSTGCTHTESVETKLKNTVGDALAQKVHIFPNPVNRRLFIQIPEEYEGASFLVLDTRGRIILNEQKIEEGQAILNVKNWDAGVYILMLHNESYKTTHRVIVSE